MTMTATPDVAEIMARAISLDLKRQMHGVDLAGPHLPDHWGAEGRTINLEEVARAALAALHEAGFKVVPFYRPGIQPHPVPTRVLYAAATAYDNNFGKHSILETMMAVYNAFMRGLDAAPRHGGEG